MSSTSILEFLWEVNITLLCLTILYVVLFRKLSFYQWNRLYLLAIPLIGIVIASMYFEVEEALLVEKSQIPITLNELFPEVTNIGAEDPANLEPQTFSYSQETLSTLLVSLLGIIAVFFYIQRAYLWITLNRRLTTTSTCIHSQTVYVTERFQTAFAFNGRVYLPSRFMNLESQDLRSVIDHEKAHIDLGHAYDNLFFSIIQPLFWYNPIFWFLKREILQIHEYQADSTCSKKTNRDQYAALLLKLSAPGLDNLFIHPFSKSLIKKRVIKLNQSNSSFMKRALFLTCLPVAAALIYAFSIKPVTHTISSTTDVKSNHEQRPFILPMDMQSISNYTPYGMRTNPIDQSRRMHRGIDLIAPEGTEIIAVKEGVVLSANSENAGYGNLVEIAHDGDLVTRYAHLQDYLVKPGQRVEQGEIIGYCGNTGKSTGPHLHFEVLKGDSALNPESFLSISASDFGISSKDISSKDLVIIIDAGHGGKDPGNNAWGVSEKDICLDYATALSNTLLSKGYTVKMTRTSDEFSSLKERTDVSGMYDNALFLSIHMNEEASGLVRGVETYTPIGDDNRSKKSLILANHFQKELNNAQIERRAVKQAKYWVIANSKCPAVLLELGFLSSEHDRKNLLDKSYKNSLVEAIVKGIDNYAQ